MPPRPPRQGGDRDRRKLPDWNEFVLPLPRKTARHIDERKRPADGDNVGLWLDKLLWRMQTSFDLKAQHRGFALSQLCRAYRSEVAAAAAERMREAAGGVHGATLVKSFRAKVEGRLLVGYGRTTAMETALTFHRVWGAPMIPGSALKGIARAHVALDATPDAPTADRLFGTTQNQGSLVFYDALPEEGRFELGLDVLTPHVRDYYEGHSPPADWLSPEPHTFVTVVKTAFVFVVGLDAAASPATAGGDLQSGVLALKQALADDGVGAKTAAGYGRFSDVRDLA